MIDCYEEIGHVGEIEYSVDNVGWGFYYEGYTTQGGVKMYDLLYLFKECCKQYDHYGIKVSHAIQRQCWFYMQPLFEKGWPGVRYVISIRHPLGIVRSIDKLRELGPLDPELPEQDIIDSWVSTYSPTKKLLEENRVILIVFPDDFISGKIETIPERLGMKWKESADIFDIDKVTIPNEQEKAEFKRQYPIAVKMFEELARWEL